MGVIERLISRNALMVLLVVVIHLPLVQDAEAELSTVKMGYIAVFHVTMNGNMFYRFRRNNL